MQPRHSEFEQDNHFSFFFSDGKSVTAELIQFLIWVAHKRAPEASTCRELWGNPSPEKSRRSEILLSSFNFLCYAWIWEGVKPPFPTPAPSGKHIFRRIWLAIDCQKKVIWIPVLSWESWQKLGEKTIRSLIFRFVSRVEPWKLVQDSIGSMVQYSSLRINWHFGS